MLNVNIAGTDFVCPTGQFTVIGLPPNSSVTSWSSANLSALTVTNGGVPTRQNNYDGSVNVTANGNYGNDGCTFTSTKPIWVGKPTITNQVVWTPPPSNYNVNPITLNPLAHYYFYMSDNQMNRVPGATDYTWHLPVGFSLFSSNGYNTAIIQTAYESGSYQLYCVASNGCGSGGARALTIIIGQGGGGGIILITAPNPSTDELTVWLKDNSDAEDMVTTSDDLFFAEDQNNKEVHYILYDAPGREVLRQSSHATMIDVRNMNEGVYILKASMGEKVYMQRLLIKK